MRPDLQSSVQKGTSRHVVVRLLAGATILALSACDSLVGVACTTEMVYSAQVEVRDAATGAPAARGVTAVSTHQSGVETELTAQDELTLRGDWMGEYPGYHVIDVRKPGYRTEVIPVQVEADRCHVETATVEATLEPDPSATLMEPIGLEEGPRTDANLPRATVRVSGDTLEVEGFAPADCRELRSVAYVSEAGIHLQIEPSNVQLDSCEGPRRFRVRHLLPAGETQMLVTSARGFPVRLAQGTVAPEPSGAGPS